MELKCAVASGNLEAVEQYLANNTNPLDVDYDPNRFYMRRERHGEGLLREAAKNNYTDIILKLAEYGARVSAIGSSEKDRLLHLAAESGDHKLANLMNRGGANVKSVNEKGETAMHVAAKNGHQDIVHSLAWSILQGSFKNIKDYDGVTLFHLMCTIQDEGNIVSRMLQYIDPSILGLEETVSRHSKFWPGYTPLHFAAAFHCYETVTLLYYYRVDFRAMTVTGMTPLHLAWRMDEAEALMKDILVQASDCSKDATERFNICWTELCTIQYNRLNTIEALMKTNWEPIDDLDKNLISYVSRQNVENIVELLSQHFDADCCEKVKQEFKDNTASFMLSLIETFTQLDLYACNNYKK